jgi:hypothetical protein
LPEGVAKGSQLPDGSFQISATGPVYRGPGATANGPLHHYVFELYALDTKLDVKPSSDAFETRANVMKAIQGHILAKAVYGPVPATAVVNTKARIKIGAGRFFAMIGFVAASERRATDRESWQFTGLTHSSGSRRTPWDSQNLSPSRPILTAHVEHRARSPQPPSLRYGAEVFMNSDNPKVTEF